MLALATSRQRPPTRAKSTTLTVAAALRLNRSWVFGCAHPVPTHQVTVFLLAEMAEISGPDVGVDPVGVDPVGVDVVGGVGVGDEVAGAATV